jgi:hypothetical protein
MVLLEFPTHIIQGDTQKSELLKNPTKIEEIKTGKTFHGDSILFTVPLIHYY